MRAKEGPPSSLQCAASAAPASHSHTPPTLSWMSVCVSRARPEPLTSRPGPLQSRRVQSRQVSVPESITTAASSWHPATTQRSQARAAASMTLTPASPQASATQSRATTRASP